MAATIKIKNSSTAGAVPTASDLVQGELAINVTDRRIYTENASGTVVELGTPSIDDNGNATAITIDSSENVGIGTSTTSGSVLNIANSSSADELTFKGTPYTVITSESTGGMDIKVSQAVPMCFYTSNSERARIDSSGNLLVGTTSTLNAVLSVVGRSGVGPSSFQVFSNGDYGATWKNASGTLVGNITVNASTTAYNTSSDYRLKENIAPMTGALATVAQLKPVTYSWKATGESTQGFIAHELQEVVPECVTGEKDAVDADGNPIYQGIDTSFLVATLTAAIQELKAVVDAQAARIEALEAK